MAIINFTRVQLVNGIVIDVQEDAAECQRRIADARTMNLAEGGPKFHKAIELTEANHKKPAFLYPLALENLATLIEMQVDTLAAQMQQQGVGGMVIPMGRQH